MSWQESNGKDSPTALIDDILADKITPYQAALTFVDSLREKDLKPGTIRQYRSMLPDFFESVLGENNFKQRTFDRVVPIGKVSTQVTKRAPKVEELRHCLNIAGPRDRALLAILCSGMRLGEAVSRKMTDLEPQENGEYYRIKLWADVSCARCAQILW